MKIVGHIIYGYPMTGDSESVSSVTSSTMYSSACGKPLAFGLEIGAFDASGVTEARQFKKDPSPTVIAQLSSKFDRLPECERAAIAKFGPPRTFIVWSTE